MSRTQPAFVKKICDVTSKDWYIAFQENARNLLWIPWGCAYALSETERERVMASVQQFELGENSEGKTFKRKALVYAQKHDPAYMDALDLFIKEEQRHSSMLRRFLENSTQPTLKKHWVDTIFRRLRKLMDVELEIIVLLTAEIIAMVYYGSLKLATNSPVLQTVCDQILLDETRHINFQSSSLYKVRQQKAVILRHVMSALHLCLLLGTTLLVWWQHHSVLSYSKTYWQFLREILFVFQKSHLISSGRI